MTQPVTQPNRAVTQQEQPVTQKDFELFKKDMNHDLSLFKRRDV